MKAKNTGKNKIEIYGRKTLRYATVKLRAIEDGEIAHAAPSVFKRHCWRDCGALTLQAAMSRPMSLHPVSVTEMAASKRSLR